MRKNILKPSRTVYVAAAAAAVGHEEKNGPLGEFFGICDEGDDLFGEKTWEAAESTMQRLALSSALAKASLTDRDIDIMTAGDLLNQCTGSGYGLLDFDIPYLGLYGACSTVAEGILTSALLVGSNVDRAAAVSSSHNCSAERQYRFPLEYGGQRPPTAQWTVTGAGAFILSSERGDSANEAPIAVSEVVPGIADDYGINDVNNMGAAMAPAAADTLLRYIQDNAGLGDTDLILTGDLGAEGTRIFRKTVLEAGYDIHSVHADCGLLIYDLDRQDKHSGGSGCGCSAAVAAEYLIPKMRRGFYKSVLFLGTGAMMSPLILQQGKNIPAIAHLVHFIRV